MFPTINPTSTAAWKKLESHFQEISKTHLRALFKEDPKRFEKFSIQFEDILLDYSKNRINKETFDLLLSLADSCGLKEAISAMFSGDSINYTEYE